MMNEETYLKIIEAALFASSQPLNANKIVALFEESERPEIKQVKTLLETLAQHYQNRGITLQQLATGWQFRVSQPVIPWVKRLWKTPSPRYSRALMETLALIAYRQPITRGEIEKIRGITVNSNIVRTLEEHGWIREVGHKEIPGRPALLATTKQFLDHFSLKSLSELPPLDAITSLETMGADLEQALSSASDNETTTDSLPYPAPLPLEDEPSTSVDTATLVTTADETED